MDIEELKRLAFEYKSRPDLQVNEVAFRNAANPAAVLELIRQRDELLAALHKITALPQHPMRKKAVEIAEAAIANAEISQ